MLLPILHDMSRTGKIVLWCAVLVVLQAYGSTSQIVFELASYCSIPLNNLSFAEVHALGRFWWLFITFLCFLIIPCFIIRFIWKEQLSAFGFRWVYWKIKRWELMLILLLLLLVFLASFHPTFQQVYPLYGIYQSKDIQLGFLFFELFYLLQFIAVEFFFRGFIVLGTSKDIGKQSIYLSLLPYCMIHLQKPFPEALGSIAAGLVLGYMSFTKQSIWIGVLLHILVAFSMDILALWQKGLIW